MMNNIRPALVAGFAFVFAWALALVQPAAASTWPVTANVNGYAVTWYEPQATAWTDHKTLTGRMAVSFLAPGKTTPVFGVVNLTADTVADAEDNTVVVSNIQVVSTSFPSLSADQQKKVDTYIRSRATDMGSRVIPLNTVVLSLQANGTAAARQVTLNTTPPQIFYSEQPAILVTFDGTPVFGPIKGMTGDLTFAVNTNWNVFKTGDTYYLLNQSSWLQAPAVNGPWKPAGALPAVFGQLPNDDNWSQVRTAASTPGPAGKTPTVWVATGQAEAIVTDGPPKAVAIPNTSLSYIENTDAALFYDRANKQYYYLTSGRWFSTSDPSSASWTFASKNLPADFAKIPADGPRGWVLASVPGTAQAAAAIGAADVPREASVSRTAATLTVTYSGDPVFKAIPGTTLEYAVNTSFDVLKVDETYYACDNGVWFTSGSPNGPWTVADSVPQSIYSIPSDQPLYNDTYVNVVNSDANTVTYSYNSGYLYSYPWYGGLYYGTGYWFTPWVGYYGGYPAYYPWPRTYVGGTYYNPATSAYARGYGVYGPYGGAKVAGGYNPSTGNYWRGGAVYGPYGGVGHGTIYNPATGNYYHGAAAWGPNGIAYRGAGGTTGTIPYGSRYGATQTTNAYKNWGNAATLKTPAAPTQFKAGYGGNVYAGKDGNVYRPTSTGSWQQYNNANGQWKTPSGQGWGDLSAKGSGFNNSAASQQYRGFNNTSGQTGWNNAATRGGGYNSTASQLNRDSYARSAGYGGGGFGGYRGGGGGFR